MLTFKHPILEELYKKDFFIDAAVLEEIIGLGEEVVPELQMIVESEISRYEEISDQDWFENFSMLHATYLLYDIDAKQGFQTALKLTCQGSDFLEYWFSDWLYEDVPEILTKLGRNNVPAYLDFLNTKEYALHSKSLVVHALTDIAFLYPERRAEIIAFLKEHLQFFLDHQEQLDELFPVYANPANLYDSTIHEYISFLLVEIQDKGLIELREQVELCMEKELHDPFILSAEEDRFENSPRLALTENIFARYKEFKRLFGEDSPHHPDATQIRVRKAKEAENQKMDQQAAWLRNQVPLLKPDEAKIGRNDPCPCGSGKKYKKCCMA